MNDYKKYLLRQMGLKEAQFVPFVREDEHPDIDPEAQMSPTARPTPIIGVAIRGSVTGGLPSGADQLSPDLAPHKLGGYNRVTPEDLNTKLVNKTPANPEIKQETTPINQNPATGQGVTHPHQIQVTAGEEPQETTGASTDSDPTLKLKSGVPKGIDIDITDQAEDTSHEEESPMIPTASLSETFARHKKLALEIIRRHASTNECATCGCGDPNKKHEDANLDEDKKRRICHHCKQPHPCSCDKKDEEDAKEQRDHPEAYRKKFGMKIDKREDMCECQKCHQSFDFGLVAEVAMGAVKCPACNAIINQEGQALFESKHKAGCECGFCKNKSSFKKKDKKDVDEGSVEDTAKRIRSRPYPKDMDKASDRAKWDRDTLKKTEPEEKDKKKEKLDESYSPPFSRMRGLAGLGKVILASNGSWTDTTVQEDHQPGASHPFNTNWKMDKEKAGFVKIDEEKLNAVKAQLEKKSKRGTLSDKELLLTKRLSEVLNLRREGKVTGKSPFPNRKSQEVDKNIGKMEKDPSYRPSPFDKDHTGPMRHGNDKGQLPSR